ncbi:MAG: proprotein convertase P-domain-containing protein [Nonlabens sp.]
MLKKSIAAVFIILSLTFSKAQEIAISDGNNISTCSGLFTDSGGTANSYSADENLTFTIYPSFPNYRTQVDFSLFDLAAGDVLIVYDGDSTSSPFIGSYGSFLAPTTIAASLNNSTGSLTFVFTSNASSSTAAGWEGQITCNTDCQTITSGITVLPAPDVDGILRVCQGEVIDIAGNPMFSDNASGSSTQYLLPDGSTVNGLNTSLSFNESGIYKVDFIVRDSQGCRDNTGVDLEIYVSTLPDFRGTEAASQSICLGETVELTGEVETVVSTPNFAPPIAGTTFLPDGSGVSYRTCIDVTRFDAGATVNSPSDLAGIFLEMEHSYLGDLEITLTAPNGSQILLHNRAGAGTYLGEPVDVDANIDPGVGYVYNFTEGSRATQTLSTIANSVQTVPAGDYLPLSPFSAVIGTELNGQWCIEVTDYLRSDNGYIFEWGLTFSRNLFAPNLVFEPQPATEGWLPNADIINTSPDGSIITIQPSTPGRHCYDYELVDSFGCSYIEQVCIIVNDVDQIPQGINDISICSDLSNDVTVDLTIYSNDIENQLNSTIVNYYNTLAEAQSQVNAVGSTLVPAITATSTVYVLLGNNQCPIIKPLTINLVASPPAGIPVDLTITDFDGDQQGIFNLSINDPILLNGLAVVDYELSYHFTAIDAQSGANPIGNPTAFTNTSNPQVIYTRVASLTGSCFETDTFVISILDNSALDSDGDGIFNNLEDLDGDGDLTDEDTDNDGTPNYLDTDDDNDTVLTADEIVGIGAGTSTNMYSYIDTDNDQVENYLDPDDDGDGLDTEDEDYNGDGNPMNDDTNNNQVPDYLDDTVTLSSLTAKFENLSIYPTLVENFIIIDWSKTDLVLNNITIYDASGRSVLSTSENLVSQSELNTQSLGSGVYFLKVISDDGNSFVERFVKR